jgi:hypothetical protein
MTIKELHELTGELVKQGYGDACVMFDTEARAYWYHMAVVGSAFFEDEPEPHLALHEEER